MTVGTVDTANAEKRIEAAISSSSLSAGAAENLQRWLTEPQYARYVPRLMELIEAGEFEKLDGLFWEVIPFGTGGRRGPMGELGSATINERTIAESAHGLAVYLRSQRSEPGGRAVVASDTRNRSTEFARLTASTLAAHGLHVYFFESPRATPELSYAVRRLNCDLGAMISASHNPPSDNGFKAYWSHGGQVLPPHDRGIIDCVYQAGEIPALDFDQAVDDGDIEVIGAEIDRAYLDEVLKLSLSDARDVPVLFTPLNGVGETSIWRVLTEAGFQNIEIFEPHRAPDGNFTNVPDQLPNPERPEVFAPAVERAKKTGAELVMASDPDADRLGAVVRDSNGEFVFLTGNQIGALLTDYVLARRSQAGTLTPEHYVVETLVTTPLTAAIGRSYGVRVVDDLLVGFKYIAQTMDKLEPDKFVFGTEESIGYLAGQYCRDKDAAVAALYLMELAAELRAEGKTLLDRLDELYVRHGYHLERQLNEYCYGSRGKEQINSLMQAFREAPPAELGGIVLDRVRDYGRHEIRQVKDNERIEELPQPEGDLMFFDSDPNADCHISMAVRPSGTEPKIKFYFFARADCETEASLPDVKSQTDRALSDMQEALAAWMKEQLSDG